MSIKKTRCLKIKSRSQVERLLSISGLICQKTFTLNSYYNFTLEIYYEDLMNFTIRHFSYQFIYSHLIKKQLNGKVMVNHREFIREKNESNILQ